ncbi:MAG: malto-oligosyltrehalose synthase [Candidatus Rokubacteria bacterium]|nr:malto-oligosyltrehalose synthase [Candidatus Rokubacteria bacterium]
MRRVPVATYRLQLSPDLDFDAAASLVDYLDALGVTDVYTSPFFETASDASHGYDVSDHGRLRDELGGEAAFARVADALKRRGLGLLVDLVPNHMGIARARNAWWRDVLENGPSSAYASVFDIDWDPVKPELHGKVLLPILGDQYGAVLDSGRLSLELDDGLFWVRYYETRLPVAPPTYGRVLSHGIEELQSRLGAEHPAIVELKSVITWFATIPPPHAGDPGRLAASADHKESGRQRLVRLLAKWPDVRAFLEDTVRRFNGTPGDPRSFDLLDALLGDQAYRLAYWRVAGEEINYRRFFDINDLAAIRVEEPRVFAETHRLVLRLVGDGTVTGLRVDHPDGLYAPAEYFRRLQEGCLEATGGSGEAPRPFYIVAEKILSPGERLPDTWAVAGTTGYDFLNLVNGIFVDRRQARALEQLYTRLTHERVSFAEIVYTAKRVIMETSMASELNMLGHRLNRISEKHRSSRDFTLRSLIRALRQIIACFPVYRTYFGDEGDETHDRATLERAVELAKRRHPGVDASVYDWIHRLLALELPPWAGEQDRRERLDFVMRFQQITGPVTAKGYEDTALYRYHRLVSLNEVGGDPSRFGTSIAEFHAAMRERQADAPAGLSTTATHDTKRGEDVRARINVLSEIPAEWRRRVARWQRLNRRHRTVVDGRPVPGPTEEYLIYQTLAGAWPITAERVRAYVVKAMREAKSSTSWITQNERYEEAMLRFTDTVLDRRRSREFLRDLGEFQERVAHFGRLNGLAQVLVKIAAPGVPDFYQGTELWDLALVDPDNRRPVDFALRRRLLDELAMEIETTSDLSALARRLAETAADGRVKLYLIRQALAFRRRHRGLFLAGAYEAIDAAGPWADSVCAFARVHGLEAALVVVPRLLASRSADGLPLGEAFWESTRLEVPATARGVYRDVFTGHRVEVSSDGLVPVAHLLAGFPVALLGREP